MITNGEIKLPDEFASTMQQLVAEAAKNISPDASVSAGGANAASVEIRAEFAALNERMAGLARAVSNGLEKVTAAIPSENDIERMQRMDEHLVALRKTESVNQRLFNSLHQELKEYRDNFLRESLQKPFIRDLVVLFDDLTSLASQMEKVGGAQGKKQAVIAQWSENLKNAIHSLVEVLHRMEVNEIEPKEMVDRAIHRVVSQEPADCAEDNGRIVLRTKRGFIWRDQVLRPEEVVAKRFT